MALAPYSEQYWYPDESLAVGVPLHVFPRLSNVHAQLYADQAGTMPIANPILTDASGFATFFVESGDYWGFIRGQAFYLIIDLDPSLTHIWASTSKWEQLAPLTVWTINHGMLSFPDVTVLSTTNEQLFGEVDYVDDANLTITFSAPTSGTAFLRR
jgi:hypothetical protein